MQTGKPKLTAIRWLMFAALVIMLGTVLNASSCGKGGEFQQSVGGNIDAESNVERTTAQHKYIADIDKRLYWPNKPKYANKIPKGKRVWILNDAGLARYKSFKPGPL